MVGSCVHIVRGAVAALNAGDIDGYFSHIDSSCKRWVVGLDQPLSVKDIRDSIIHLRSAFDDLFLHEDMLFGNEQFVCARWRMQGVHVKEYLGIAPQQRSINLQSCEIYAFAGESITTVWTYGDPGQLMRQIASAG